MNPQQAYLRSRQERLRDSSASARVTPGLALTDPRIAGLIEAERYRQQEKLVLIASESMCPAAVREATASEFSNLYAEGYPSSRMAMWERAGLDWDARHHSFYNRYGDRRYYKGCEVVNLIEAEAMRRVAALFATDGVPAADIFANVQSLSGAAANNAVYEALVPPQGTVMGMNLSCGGHLTHGSPVNRSGRNYKIVSYEVPLTDGRLDFVKLREMARQAKPNMIIAGYSAYPWTIDWAEFRSIADEVGAYLLADIAHPAGLVAAGEFPSPLPHAHAVSFTTHKTLCGPRGACILSTDPEIARRIDFAVFPGEQGGPHIQAIAGKAVAFRMAHSDEFRALQRRVRENAAALARGLAQAGFTLAYGGTDTHLCLVDLKPFQTGTGEIIEADIAARVLDLVGITCNKNAIAGDTRPAHPNGLRFGTTWATQRGLGPEDMESLAEVIGHTLSAMRAFWIHTGAGQVGRVRLPAAALRDARDRMKALLARDREASGLGPYSYPQYEPDGPAGVVRPGVEAFGEPTAQRELGASTVAVGYAPAAEEAAALRAPLCVVDTCHVPVVQVVGERADLALQQTMTGDLLRLEEGRHTTARAYRPDGRLLGEFRVARLPDLDGGMLRYLLLGDAGPALEMLQWLRDLSDGFVAFDDDITRKVDGPVVVEDLGAAPALEGFGLRPDLGPSVLLTVTGADAGAALARTGVPEPGEGEVSMGAEGTFALRHTLPSGASVCEVIVPAVAAEALTATLLKDGRKAGEQAYLAYRAEAGAPAAGEPHAEPGEFERSKPYFVGQAHVVQDFADPDRAHFEYQAPTDELRATPLNAWHRAHTKKWNMVPFAGWDMPVMYTSIVEEHRAVRSAGGLFDVSHMGCLEVRGPNAARFLDLVTTNYVTRLRDGEGHYSYSLAVNGSVLDDLIIYRRDAHRFLVVVNASNADKIFAFWKGAAEHRYVLDPARPAVRFDGDVEVLDLKDPAQGEARRVDLAFQGKASTPVLRELCDDDASRENLRRLRRFGLTGVSLCGRDVLVARTGYTGEAVGYELYVHPDHAVELWEKILDAGAARGVVAAGLGARDSTRTEAGFPLYGHELAGDFDITPPGAGYASFVKWHKAFFVGREGLLESEKRRDLRIFRARITDPAARPVRAGDTVVDAKGRYFGRVTSAAYAGADQILLIYGKRLMMKTGGKIGVFPLPRNNKPLGQEPAKDVLQMGDSVLLPIPGEVVGRFMTAAEKRKRNYQR